MDQYHLGYRLTMHHRCGMDFEMNSHEWPPRVVICPGCEEVLMLHAFDSDTNVTSYSRRGTYQDLKERKHDQ